MQERQTWNNQNHKYTNNSSHPHILHTQKLQSKIKTSNEQKLKHKISTPKQSNSIKTILSWRKTPKQPSFFPICPILTPIYQTHQELQAEVSNPTKPPKFSLQKLIKTTTHKVKIKMRSTKSAITPKAHYRSI